MVTIEEKTFNITTTENNIEVVPVEQKITAVEVNSSIPGAKGDKGDQGIQGEQGQTGPKGDTGSKGDKGDNATINGLNAINILAGENIELEQTEDNLTINGLNTLNIVAGDNITIDQEDDTLTINATATPQIQSDMAQEDDTQVDYVKNKHANYIKATLYGEDEEGEQIPIYEGTANELFNLYLFMINDTYESLYDEIDRKQDPLEDISVTIYHSSWVDNEATVYCNVSVDTKIWYSPTEDSYDDFVESEIRMTEQTYGSVKFKCETTPEEDIYVLIRRA